MTIAKYLDTKKFDVEFCIIERPLGNSTIDEFIPPQYSKSRIPNVRSLKQLWALYKVLKAKRPNIVFSSIMHANTKLLALSLLFPKIKFIVRNNNYLYTLSNFQKLVIRCTYRFAGIIVAQTEEMREELIREVKICGDKIKVLPNPIDVDTIDSMQRQSSPYGENENIKYVASGRFVPAKGFDILIKAFSMVLEKQQNSELYIVGNIEGNCAECFESIRNLAKKVGVERFVHFVGYQHNPYVFVKNANCFVLSSRNEGLPNVLIEALYLGTPVAATKCIPVISRIVEDGVNGFLAEPEDEKSLATAMMRASRLGRVSCLYQSANIADFQSLFV